MVLSGGAFLSFLLICLLIEATPGPNMAYLAILSANEGRKAGFSAVAGVAIGLLAIGAAVALGLSSLMLNMPILYESLKWGGVIYLLYLAWDIWRAGSIITAGGHQAGENSKFFRRGIFTNLLNPKAALFYTAVFPDFINASSPVISQFFILTAIYVATATIIHSLIVMAASQAHAFLKNSKQTIFIRRMFSLALAGIAVWFACGGP